MPSMLSTTSPTSMRRRVSMFLPRVLVHRLSPRIVAKHLQKRDVVLTRDIHGQSQQKKNVVNELMTGLIYKKKQPRGIHVSKRISNVAIPSSPLSMSSRQNNKFKMIPRIVVQKLFIRSIRTLSSHRIRVLPRSKVSASTTGTMAQKRQFDASTTDACYVSDVVIPKPIPVPPTTLSVLTRDVRRQSLQRKENIANEELMASLTYEKKRPRGRHVSKCATNITTTPTVTRNIYKGKAIPGAFE